MSIVTMPPRKPSVAPVLSFPGTPKMPKATTSRTVARRCSPQQGRALEALGHAVEYLVDSRLFLVDQAAVRSDDEAVQIMMRLSRAVFAECPEAVPLRRKLGMWLVERLANPSSLDEAR